MKKIFTNGCFDILHIGHIKLLEFCKQQGDYVIVGLNSDESIKRLKGEKRPINNEHNRLNVLKSIKYVDQVFIFNEDTPYRLIKTINPDIIVKGGDYKKEEVVGNDLAEVIIFNYINGHSTTKTLEKLNDICI
jgi:D-beta-D-heptose 7-phosphate kinase/D-beta-D-heptose 1-phosphate adenosyltransferase